MGYLKLMGGITPSVKRGYAKLSTIIVTPGSFR